MPESLNATTPITTLGGWRWTKSVAAAIAAAIRVGWRSVAAMLPEMSNARMTVPSLRGTSIRPCGRASAMTMTVKPATRRIPGMRRRIRPTRRGDGPPAAGSTDGALDAVPDVVAGASADAVEPNAPDPPNAATLRRWRRSMAR